MGEERKEPPRMRSVQEIAKDGQHLRERMQMFQQALEFQRQQNPNLVALEGDHEAAEKHIRAGKGGETDWIGGLSSWTDWDHVRGIGNGAANFGYSMYDLVGHSGLGLPRANKLFPIDPFGQQTSVSGGFLSGIVQFGLGFGTVKLGQAGFRSYTHKRRTQLLKEAKADLIRPKTGKPHLTSKSISERLKAKTGEPTSNALRSRKWMSILFEGAAHGAIADFIAFDPEQGNFLAPTILNYLYTRDGSKLRKQMPEFEGLLTDIMVIPPEIWADPKESKALWDQFTNRLANVGEGVIAGIGVNALIFGLKTGRLRHALVTTGKKLETKAVELDTLMKQEGKIDVEDMQRLEGELAAAHKQVEETFHKMESMGLNADRSYSQWLRTEDYASIYDGSLRASKGDEILEGFGKDFEPKPPPFEEWVKTSDDPAAVKYREAEKTTKGEPTISVEDAEDLVKYANKELQRHKNAGSTIRAAANKALKNAQKTLEKAKKAQEAQKAGEPLSVEEATELFKQAEKEWELLEQGVPVAFPPPAHMRPAYNALKDAEEALIRANEKEFWYRKDAEEAYGKQTSQGGGKVFKRSFDGDPFREGRLISSDGTDIWLDLDAIQADFDKGMPFITGSGINKNGRSLRASQQERAIAEFMNLDVAKLKNLLEKRGGAEAYATFLYKRQQNITKILKEEGFDINKTELSIQEHSVKKMLAKATYDALVHDMGIEARFLSKNEGSLKEFGAALDPEVRVEEFFSIAPDGSKRTGKASFDEIMKQLDDADVDTLNKIMRDLTDSKVFNFKLDDGTDMESSKVLIALTQIFTEALSPKAKNVDEYAKVFGYVKGADTTSAESAYDAVIKGIKAELEQTAEVLGITAEELHTIVRTGEGPFQGGVKHIKIDDAGDLGTKEWLEYHTETHGRLMAIRTQLVERGKDINQARIDFQQKVDSGEATTEDYFRFSLQLSRQAREMVLLKDSKRSWGLDGLAQQQLQRLEELHKLGLIKDSEYDEIMRQKIEAFSQGGKGGEEALQELAERMQSVTQGAKDDHAKALELAKFTQNATFLGAINDVWVNAMLSGLRTQSVNNISTLIRTTVGTASKYVGAVAPGSGFEDALKTLSGKEVSDALARKYVRQAAWRQEVIMLSMLWDAGRIILKNSDIEEIAVKEGIESHSWRSYRDVEGAQKAAEASDVTDMTSKSVAEGGAIEQSLKEFEGSDASSKNLFAAGRGWAKETLGESRGDAVSDYIENNPLVKYMAQGWDFVHQSVLRQGIRKMVRGDQLFKQIIARSHIKAHLMSEAIHVQGLKDPKDIAAWVAKYSEGLLRENGTIFNKKALRNEGMEAAEEAGLSGKAANDHIDNYVSEHWDLTDERGRVTMSGEQREAVGDSLRNEIREFTFTTAPNKYRDELEELKKQAEEDGTTLKVGVDSTPRNPFAKRGEPGGEPSYYGYGNWTNILSEAAQSSPFLRMFFPFVTTPSNIFKDIGRHSPLSNAPVIRRLNHSYLADMNSGDIGRIAGAKGRNLMGTMIFGTALAYAWNNRMTGSGPSDPKANADWRHQGNEPYCFIMADGTQVSFERLEPYAYYFRLAADMHENWLHKREDEEWHEWYDDASKAAVHSLSEAVMTKHYMSDFTILVDLLNFDGVSDTNPLGKYEDLLSKRVGSMTPNILEALPGSLDQTKREVRSIFGRAVAKVYPWGLPPARLGITGEIIPNNELYPNRLMHAFTFSKSYKPTRKDSVYQELVSLGSAIGSPTIREFGEDYLNRTNYYAEINIPKPAKVENAKDKKKRLDRSNALENIANNFRAPGGARCPVKPGQDVYDFWQQYMSVRKVKVARAMSKVASSTFEEFQHEMGDTERKLLEDWIKSVKSLDNKPVTLRTYLNSIIGTKEWEKMKEYEETQEALDTRSVTQKKSVRLDILRKIIQTCREDSWNELVDGIKKDGSVNPKNSHKGIISAFWVDYAGLRMLNIRQNALRERNALGEEPLGKSPHYGDRIPK